MLDSVIYRALYERSKISLLFLDLIYEGIQHFLNAILVVYLQDAVRKKQLIASFFENFKRKS